MSTLVAFAAGLIFGLGLIVSGMSNPAKVIGFLDLGGRWDPSLALVMAGAVAVAGIAFRIATGRATTLLGSPMCLPTARQIDRMLLVGSALFGVGWGLAGICPGPALVLVGAGSAKGIVFMLALLLGMGAYEAYQRPRQS